MDLLFNVNSELYKRFKKKYKYWNINAKFSKKYSWKND